MTTTGSSAASIIATVDVNDPVALRRALYRLAEQVDTAFGDKGVQTPTATVENVKQKNLNSAVGVNKEDNINTLRQRIQALEIRVTQLEG